MQTLKTFVGQYMTLEKAEWEMLEEKLAFCTYRKGEMIHDSHDIWDRLYFVRSGLIRSYIMSARGKEATRQFHFNNDQADILNLFVVDYASMVESLPGTIGFEVLEDCELISISSEAIDEMHADSKTWERLSRMFLEDAYMKSTAFYQSLINKTAKENYQYICEHMSHLVALVPQYHLATYIGITPVSLSRVKQELESS